MDHQDKLLGGRITHHDKRLAENDALFASLHKEILILKGSLSRINKDIEHHEDCNQMTVEELVDRIRVLEDSQGNAPPSQESDVLKDFFKMMNKDFQKAGAEAIREYIKSKETATTSEYIRSLKEPTLLPCPFCGGEEIDRVKEHIREAEIHKVFCTSCEAATVGLNRENSLQNWNTRA